ncbi:MAG: zf-HC2 domain-containing protein [Acidimicrobiales bacterium]
MRLWSKATSLVRCVRTMRILQAYLDGNLDDVSARRAGAHLEECRRCGLETSVYTEIKAVLRAKDRPVDADALDRLRLFGERLASGGESTLGDHRA